MTEIEQIFWSRGWVRHRLVAWMPLPNGLVLRHQIGERRRIVTLRMARNEWKEACR